MNDTTYLFSCSCLFVENSVIELFSGHGYGYSVYDVKGKFYEQLHEAGHTQVKYDDITVNIIERHEIKTKLGLRD